jgi:hypothetical protein
MARHRRQPDEVPVPPELVKFTPEEWADAGDVTWYPAYRRWGDARRAWGEDHPDSELGDPIDQLHAEMRVRDDMSRGRPLEAMGGVHVQNSVIREGVYDPVTGGLRGRLPGEEDIPAGGTGTRYCDWFPASDV